MRWVLQGTPGVLAGWLLCEQLLPELDFGVGVSGEDLWLSHSIKECSLYRLECVK